MADPVRTLLLEIEEQCGQIPGCKFRKADGGETRVRKLRTAFSTAVSPGYAAFVSRYDGGHLLRPVAASGDAGGGDPSGGGDAGKGAADLAYLHILGFEESQRVLHEVGQPQDWKGLWPVA